MWDIVWVSPQGHRSVSVSCHFFLQAPQCPLMALNSLCWCAVKKLLTLCCSRTVQVMPVYVADLRGVCISWRLTESATSPCRPQVCKPSRCYVILWRWQVSQAWILGLFHHGRVVFLLSSLCIAADSVFSWRAGCSYNFRILGLFRCVVNGQLSCGL